MMMLSNPKRGCGQLQRDAYYLRSESMPGGSLSRVTLWLGDHLTPTMYAPRRNLAINPPPRGVLLIDPIESLQQNDIIRTDVEQAMFRMKHEQIGTNVPAQWAWMGRLALLDHVGESSYPTPMSFMEEVARLGVSRHVPKRVAKQLAGISALPIIFTHSNMPWFDTGKERDTFLAEMGSNPNSQWREPTWDVSQWSGYSPYAQSDAYYGWNHFMVPVLQKQHDNPAEAPFRQFEAAYFSSWVTHVVYVAPSGLREEQWSKENPDLVDAGIEFGVIVEEEDDEDLI